MITIRVPFAPNLLVTTPPRKAKTNIGSPERGVILSKRFQAGQRSNETFSRSIGRKIIGPRVVVKSKNQKAVQGVKDVGRKTGQHVIIKMQALECVTVGEFDKKILPQGRDFILAEVHHVRLLKRPLAVLQSLRIQQH